MKYQRGESIFEFIIFIAAVVAVVTLIFAYENPELRDGVLEVETVNCPTIVPGDETDCTLTVTTTDPGRLGNTRFILQLKEGEELVPETSE